MTDSQSVSEYLVSLRGEIAAQYADFDAPYAGWLSQPQTPCMPYRDNPHGYHTLRHASYHHQDRQKQLADL